jgi:hypothetical protein
LIQQEIHKLRSIGDLRRALVLPGWRPQDLSLRQKIGKRLALKLGAALESSYARRRRAAAGVIEEIGGTIPPLGTDTRGTFTTSLAPALVKLLKSDGHLGVRQAAARALGRTHAGPRENWVVEGKKAKLQIYGELRSEPWSRP